MNAASHTFDYVIVGAGSAGCVVANRLSANPSVRVLLIEAGPRDNSIFLRMPAAMGIPLETTRFNWKYLTEPEAGLNGRVSEQHRGRVLGGSSSINGMIFNRGNPRDFDGWAQSGLSEWSFAHCLPYFRRMETFDGGADSYRGGDGPLLVHRCRAENPLYQAFLEAGVQYGIGRTHDHNGQKQEGVHLAQVTIRNGTRESTAQAYLKPLRGRSNLTVQVGAQVDRLTVSGNRVTGVAFTTDSGATHRVEAEREVILCAGAIGSAHLLMLSGLGDADDLRAHGVQVAQHLPGVGRHLQDHIGVPVQYKITKPLSPTRQLSPVGRVFTGARWMLTKGGLGASNYFEVGAFFRTGDDTAGPDIQQEFFPMIGMYHQGKAQAWDGFQYFTSLMHPESQGSIRLKSADPKARPELRFNYLSAGDDLKRLARGIRMTQEMVRQSAWDGIRGAAFSPDADVTDDAGLEAWIRKEANTGYHPVATCRMGSDDMSVTDQQGRVHGIEGLRVIDASLMPNLPTGNTNASTIMLAEKLSDAVMGRALPPTPIAYA
ncbi:choline dehydrogenase [Pseudogemmobacter humi]|uniref:Oxygen-dependent choline dehydrogenase n=1 Tax=Pseudogemmobacter humi TaxID=2483812 RepID=A0A3P5WTA8_9RHOB|nr:choline dehydrogenase [Pseudogemmobacter humi]VDC19214.1 Oxygen-dependent choline dehydrogenase [Pseudogemmobacter humi]